MPTRFLNRIPIVASPTFLLADVFGPSEAAAAKLSLANLRDLLRQPRESSASLGRNPLFSTQSFPMPRSTLVLAVAVVLAFATSLHAAKIVLIADAENNLIRRYVPPTGKILRVAGTGKKGAAGLDGPPDQAELARPHGVTIHRDGTLYITDSYNDRILKIGP